MKPFGIISDTHNHNWSAFSTVNEGGVNSRLQFTLDETTRAAREVLAAGGSTLIHAGDLFHVRGSIAPSVLNPTLDCYRAIIASGLKVILLAGNHDLEGKEAHRVSSAITALEDLGCMVVNDPTVLLSDINIALVPWIQDVQALKLEIETIADPEDRPDLDLFLHAPVDGVIGGIPPHGLSDTYLAELGFRRVFCGHYHNHKDFGNGVFSIGALSHQTWGDVGSKAGFLIVNDGGVTWQESQAPKFVELNEADIDNHPGLKCKGNFVKLRLENVKASEIEQMRKIVLEKFGAAAAMVVAEKTTSINLRTGSTYKAGTSVEQSIGDFIAAHPELFPPEQQAAINQKCAEILGLVRSVA